MQIKRIRFLNADDTAQAKCIMIVDTVYSFGSSSDPYLSVYQICRVSERKKFFKKRCFE